MKKTKISSILTPPILTVLAVLFVIPILLVFINSFKSKFYIIGTPFELPDKETFVGLSNYIKGLSTSGFFEAFLRSVFITVGSVILIVICTSMTAWYITRVKTVFTKMLYYLFVFSMVVPFQMVMYTMTFTVTSLNLDNPVGIIFVYLGFGAGLSVFMLSGFVKSVPNEIEEAAMIDGCTPLQTFFRVVFPILKPTAITVAILNAMWIWNDYLLPYLILGTGQKTVPVAIQISMQGAYGSVDWGGFMAMLVLAIIPIIVFYLSSQKYIIKGVVAGAVKG
ncbi:MAG: carbohydrate ABC transporter permease [Clostridia bacterium]|nr:carbohydrate ABC transporter permease [Clostridia bacterium]